MPARGRYKLPCSDWPLATLWFACKVDVAASKVDYLTVAGHKLYAPKGIGALYIRKGTPPIEPLMHGAGHEGGRRAGTENVLLAAGLGKACEMAHKGLSERMRHMVMRLRA
jgi:cysteine desulfurase